ncbi:MAG: hypothetical protein JNK48_17485 [Bryobacterales bacterium]|nr:hypothetical protein [Bryobacterales bacterium]
MHFVLVLGLASASLLFAVSEPEAEKLFAAQDWKNSAEAYRQLAAQDPSRASHWFRLGVSLQALRQPEESLAALTKARALRYKPPALYIRAAIQLTEARRFDAAIDWLRELTQSGFSPNALDNIAPLAELRKSGAYQSFRSNQPLPCSAPEHRAFDFWIGNFEVRNPQGQVAGNNRIEKVLNGCALQERWTSKGGADAGRSLTWFDPDIRKWRQTYIAGTGHSQDYIGEFRNGALHLLHDRAHPDGTRHMLRMTYSLQNAGNVRQFIEESWDAGKTWAVWFDGLYVPSPPQDNKE